MKIANNHIYAMEKRFLAEYLENVNNEVSAEVREEKYKVFLDAVDMEAEKRDEKPYSIMNDSAIIEIKGILQNRPQNFIEWFLGINVTNYADIIRAIKHANNNDAVKTITLLIDSPGGNVSGVDQAAQVIRNSEKDTKAVVVSIATSGAYWLASQADYIEASSPVSLLGSVGVVTTMMDKKGYYSKAGVVVETIVSTGAEKKRPDIKTQEGIEIVKEELNQIHKVFVRRIAEGREVSESYVAENFGQGAVLTAENAVKVSMIDFVSGEKDNDFSSQNIDSSELNTVDLQQNEVKRMEIKKTDDNLEIETPKGGDENEKELSGMASVFKKMIDENGGE